MSAVTRPRGPLPPRVYWTRRALVLGVALALVFGVGRLLGGGSDGKEPENKAEQVAGEPSQTPGGKTSPTVTRTPTVKATKKKKPKPPPLAAPEGTCVDSDVMVEPYVNKAVAGGNITIGLKLTTKESEACTWEVSAESLVVKITSGKDNIWSTQQCPKAIPTRSVVVRRDAPAGRETKVGITWSGRRSDEDCSRLTSWADKGWYYATVAVFGSDPDDVHFEVETPKPKTVYKTEKPKKKATKKPTKKSQPTEEPSDNKSDGAQEPN